MTSSGKQGGSLPQKRVPVSCSLGSVSHGISKLGNVQAHGNATLYTDRHDVSRDIGRVFNNERAALMTEEGGEGGAAVATATGHLPSQHPHPFAGDESEAPCGQAARTRAGEWQSSAHTGRLSRAWALNHGNLAF